MYPHAKLADMIGVVMGDFNIKNRECRVWSFVLILCKMKDLALRAPF
jgi:hypothetical protein